MLMLGSFDNPMILYVGFSLKIAKVPKMRSRTKHINLKYHHFRSFVDKGLLSIHPVGTRKQASDIMNKAIPLDDFLRHRLFLMGW